MNVLSKTFLSGVAVSVLSVFSVAQAPAGAPAGSTGQCKDGTYSTAPSKRGACAGHKGVQTWYVADATSAPTPVSSAKPATPAQPPPAAKPAPAPATPAAPQPPAPPSRARTTPATAAPGGGNGQVWVNTSTNVYHCSTDRYYGKTKQGAYMSEADAKAKGARPDAGKPCS